MKACYFSVALSPLSNHLPCGAVLGNKHGGHETIESLKDEGSLLLFFCRFVILVVKSFTRDLSFIEVPWGSGAAT